MPKIFNRIFYAAVIFLLSSAAAFAQWDVTDHGKETAIKQMKNKKMDMKAGAGDTMEMQADQVQYDSGNSTAKASGNVVVTSGAITMYADQMVLDRTRQTALATGRVYLDSPQFQVDADGGKFNFQEKTGEFDNARIFEDPFQVKGQTVAKVADNHMVMEDGYMTTCDHDIPHWRMQARRMDIYAGDKAVAKGVTMYIGRVPVMYLPSFTQNLAEKPWFTFIPGHKKDLGTFLLTRSRFKINENLTTTVRVDLYERQGVGYGTENQYHTASMGSGIFRNYFIGEHEISANHPWEDNPTPSVQNKRYQVEWRHKWDIDDRTSAMWQYYRLSDNVILKKYFEREYRVDPNPSTYFLLTRAMSQGTLSLRIDHRVNRFVSAVDRTPEVNYNVASLPLGESGFYLKSNNTASNLVSLPASPTDDRRKTFRVDTDNEITYPTHISFVQVTPMVGGDTTYYSRTNDERHPTDVVRGTFKTGVDLTTRFLKVMNVHEDFLGIKIDRLRHIISPGIHYLYQHAPSFAPSRLNQFDTAIDGLDQQHVIGFSLENKLQTKRGKQVIDLVRVLTTVDYDIKQKGAGGQLLPVKNLVEITPYDWLRMVSETTYDHRRGHLAESNFDLYFRKGNKFGFDIGDRYVRKSSHDLVTQVAYVVNPKWRFKIYNRFAVNDGHSEEQGLTITRDLHEWEMNMAFDTTHGSGTSFVMSFTLKAFPGQPLDLFGTTFHERRAGTQSNVSN